MTIRIVPGLQNNMADQVTSALDEAAPNAIIEIYTGPQPASATDPATGTLLATFTLNTTSFDPAVAGVINLITTPAIVTTGADAGTAGWARASAAGTTVFDGSVTGTGGGGDFQMSTTTVSNGLDLELTAGTMTMPSGE